MLLNTAVKIFKIRRIGLFLYLIVCFAFLFTQNLYSVVLTLSIPSGVLEGPQDGVLLDFY